MSGLISGLKRFLPYFSGLKDFISGLKNTLRADRREIFFAVPNAFLKGNTCFRCIFQSKFSPAARKLDRQIGLSPEISIVFDWLSALCYVSKS